jgi:hypothetical protein
MGRRGSNLTDIMAIPTADLESELRRRRSNNAAWRFIENASDEQIEETISRGVKEVLIDRDGNAVTVFRSTLFGKSG